MSSKYPAMPTQRVEGSLDTTAFDWTSPVSNEDLITLFNCNPTMNMFCQWRVAEALKHWIIFKKNDELQQEIIEDLKLRQKFQEAIQWAELFGDSLMIMTDGNKPEEKPHPQGFLNCQPFHALATTAGGGWDIKPEDIDELGQPFQVSLQLMLQVKSGVHQKLRKIPMSRCVFFKAPRKTNEWRSIPPSMVIAKMCQAEQLLIQSMGRRAQTIVQGGFWLWRGLSDPDVRAHVKSIFKGGNVSEMYLPEGEIKVEWVPAAAGSVPELAQMVDIFANYQARGMRVSRQAMDGAPEGTLSSSTTNMSMTYAGIEQIQSNYKPYMEDVFSKLGLSKDFDWVNPVTPVNTFGQTNPALTALGISPTIQAGQSTPMTTPVAPKK